jgi:hypothetical protein
LREAGVGHGVLRSRSARRAARRPA